MNAGELLKETRELLADCKIDGPSGLSTGTLEMIGKVIAHIDAYLSTPSESAMEILYEIRHGKHKRTFDGELIFVPDLSITDAIALIESYGRRVPKAMLLELLREYWPMGDKPMYDKAMVEIAAKYGVVIE